MLDALPASASIMARVRSLAARGETPPAFGRRCIPADCVAPPSNIPDILSRRALSAGRLAALGATADFHHGLLADQIELRLAAIDPVPAAVEQNGIFLECEPPGLIVPLLHFAGDIQLD